MASNPIDNSPSSSSTGFNEVNENRTIYNNELRSSLDNIAIPTDASGNNEVYTNAKTTATIIRDSVDITSGWTFSVSNQVNVTTSVASDVITVTNISSDTGYFTIRAAKSGEELIYKDVGVYKAKQGVTGLTGPAGTFTWEGVYVAGTTYSADDAIHYDGSAYVSLQDSNTGNTPNSSPTYWEKFAEGGLSIQGQPGSITIPTDSTGTVISYTNSISTLVAYLGPENITSDWTFAIQATSNTSAAIQNDDEVKISSLTADEGSVTVRGSHATYDDYDNIIPVRKQYKGQAVVDASSIDDETIGLNGSTELYLKRDTTSADTIFGSEYLDFITYDSGTTYSSSADEYRFRASTFRNAESPGKKSIEHSSSANSYYEGNLLLGAENLLGPTFETTHSVENMIYSGGYRVELKTTEGNATTSYAAGKSLLVYNDNDDTNNKYYISGIIDSSSYNGFYTTIAFTEDFTYTDSIFTFLDDNTSTSAGDIKAVAYTPLGYGISKNTVLGRTNKINGISNYISGGSNIIYGNSNTICGSSWKINNPLTSSDNVFVGIGRAVSESIICGGANVVIGNYQQINAIDNSGSGINALVGISNYVGSGTVSGSDAYDFNVLLGTYNNGTANAATSVGIGGKTRTNGEIVLSSSTSSVQKSIVLLEETTSSTSSVYLQTLARSGVSAIAAYSESFQLENNTAFAGTLDITGFKASGDMTRTRYLVEFYCDGAGTIHNKRFSSDTSYYYASDGFWGNTSIATSANTYHVVHTPSTSTTIKWTGVLEGIIMDI